MKVKTLATAFTLSLPLVFGGAYAQTTTTAESGNNRSADGSAKTTNPAPGDAASGTGWGTMRTGTPEENTATTPKTTDGKATGNTTRNTDSTASSATGNTATTGAAAGAHNSTGAAATPGAAAGAGAAAGTGAHGTTGAAVNANVRSPDANAPGMETRDATTEAITGWSTKDDLMGKSVFNENDEKIGDIEDVVVSSDGRSMYLLVGAGGFLGMGGKNVAVPFDRFERRDDRILLSGYTKEQLKALPEVRTQRR